jgi:hypothetical protein
MLRGYRDFGLMQLWLMRGADPLMGLFASAGGLLSDRTSAFAYISAENESDIL